MRKKFYILLLLISILCQAQDYSFHKKVLLKNNVGKEFISGKWDRNGNTALRLTYLGTINTISGNEFKIINSVLIWGLSHRATSRIMIFNAKNQYVGNYYVSVINDLPTSLEDGLLIFKNKDENCDCKIKTVINFKNGLPKQFFRRCTQNMGDIYTFK